MPTRGDAAPTRGCSLDESKMEYSEDGGCCSTFCSNFLSCRPSVPNSSWIDDDGPIKGVWMERLLMFSELRDEDFHTNYTCQVHSDRGLLHGYFTLLPTGTTSLTVVAPNTTLYPKRRQ